MRFVRRLTSKMGMRGKRPTNEGAQRAAVEKLHNTEQDNATRGEQHVALEKPRDTEQDNATKREQWRLRVAQQMGHYVGALEAASHVARKRVAGQLRKGLHAVRSINISILIKYLLSFVTLDKATVYVGVPGIRFRGASRLMSDTVHVYMDVEVIRVKINVNPRRLRFTRPSVAKLKSAKLPFTVPDVTKLTFAVGPEDRQPYITITDPGTPTAWKDRLRDELDERPRCWGASERPIHAGQLINLLVKYGVVGWQAVRETKQQAGAAGE